MAYADGDALVTHSSGCFICDTTHGGEILSMYESNFPYLDLICILW